MIQLRVQLYARYPVSLGDQPSGPDADFDPDAVVYEERDVESRDEAEQVIRERSLWGDGYLYQKELCDIGDGGPNQWFDLPGYEEEIITSD